MKAPRLENLFPKLIATGVVIWVGATLAIYFAFPNWETRAQFGEMFGAVSALFSALAFAGVIYAVILQRQDLSMQREEMELSRKELAAQNQLISAQLTTMQESFAFERHKEILSSEPLFVFTGGANMQREKTCKFRNAGAPITDITIEAPSTIRVQFQPTRLLDRGQEASLTLTLLDGSEVPDVPIAMSYTDRLGSQQIRRFVVPRGTVELREQSKV
jgi:hypothetical protein